MKNEMDFPRWVRPNGKIVACTEKLKVLNDNYEELHMMIKDALEDALLMGCSEAQVRQSFHDLIDAIKSDVEETRNYR